jgi:pimeloyl-ACP methyl ester carboxylesterase
VTTVPHYVDEGEGPALVLLHSGGMAHQEWDVHREAFEQRFRVLAPDLPGHGRTPLTSETLTVAGMRDAVEAAMEDAGVGSAHVVGSSMGGAVALRLAAERPDLVDRLVCFRIGYRRDTKDVANELSLDDPDYWRRIGMAEWLSRVHEPQGGPQAWKQVVDRAANLPRRDPDAHSLDEEDLATIEAPTLVVAGDRDPIVPVEEGLAMYRTIPEADLWIIPHAAHVVAARTWRREAFQEEVVRFLRDTRHAPERP